MEAFHGLIGVPLGCCRPARLSDVLAFLNELREGSGFDNKLHDLIWGLVGVNLSRADFDEPARSEELEIPVEFGLPRLLVEPLGLAPFGDRWGFASEDSEHVTKPEPNVFHALVAGRGCTIDMAARRLRACGLTAVGHRNRQTDLRSLAVVSAHATQPVCPTARGHAVPTSQTGLVSRRQRCSVPP